MQEGFNLKAGGDIRPSRFVTLSTSENQTVVESNASDKLIVGISQEGVKDARDDVTSTLAAADNENLRVHFPGEICLLEMDATGCTAGDFLKPDNDGKGDVASTGDEVGAFALETAAGGEKVLVLVLQPGYQMP
jgi:hypothetical protein